MMADLSANGYLLVPALLDLDACARVGRLVGPQQGAGSRSLLAHPWCAQLARRLYQDVRLAPLIGPDMVAFQCNYFEKSAQQNWLVALHQDLSIPVAARVSTGAAHGAEQLRGWSVKEGCHFVQPPASLLEQLVAVRIHLDACGPDDGPLRVVPGSHHAGIVPQNAALAMRDAHGQALCCAGIGDALLLRPLLLHASSRSTGNSRRRVLHFVFGPCILPFGLEWHTMV